MFSLEKVYGGVGTAIRVKAKKEKVRNRKKKKRQNGERSFLSILHSGICQLGHSVFMLVCLVSSRTPISSFVIS